MRFFLELSYLGTRYKGWQVQKDEPTVQLEVNRALSTVLNEPVSCMGAGRTDTGVHARQMFAHFDSSNPLPADFRKRLNLLLPGDIACLNVFPVELNAHARFDARLRAYEYHIHFEKDPFLADFSYYYPYGQPDLHLLRETAAFLETCRDFAALSKKDKDQKNTLCEIIEIRWETKNNGKQLVFYVVANRFLRGLVRRMVGVQLMVARGKLMPEELEAAMRGEKKLRVNVKAPAQGLYLARIEYPYLKN